MSIRISAAVVLALALVSATVLPALGQQIGVTTPFVGVNDSYFERTGVSFGGRFGSPNGAGSRSFGFFGFNQGPGFNQGSAASAIPPFGGYDPNSGARFGFSRFNPNGSGFSLNFDLAKGSSRSIVSSAPSLMVQNGFGGSITSGQFSPFVTGLIPVVGQSGPPVIDNGVTRAMNSGQLKLEGLGESRPESTGFEDRAAGSSSTATTNPRSLGAIADAKDAARRLNNAKIDELLLIAKKFEQDGLPGQARLNLKRALALCKDNGRTSEIRKLIAALEQSAESRPDIVDR